MLETRNNFGMKTHSDGTEWTKRLTKGAARDPGCARHPAAWGRAGRGRHWMPAPGVYSPDYCFANCPLLQFSISSQSRLLMTLLTFLGPGSYTYMPLLVIVNTGTW